MKNKDFSDLLIRSMDEALSPDEQQQLSEVLATSPALRQERQELIAMRKAIQHIQATPATDFADRVMKRLPNRQNGSFTSAIIQLYPQAAAACVAILLISLLSIYFSEGSLSVDAIVGIQELSIDEAYSLVNE